MRTSAAYTTLILLVVSITALPVGKNAGLHILSKRLENPPMPSSEELKAHLLTPDRDECMFYTGGTLIAAQDYADNNG